MRSKRLPFADLGDNGFYRVSRVKEGSDAIFPLSRRFPNSVKNSSRILVARYPVEGAQVWPMIRPKGH
jgi:hypothetical protein